jgi:hypothetical protein
MDEHHNEDYDEVLDNQIDNLIINLKLRRLSMQVLVYQENVQMAIYLKL